MCVCVCGYNGRFQVSQAVPILQGLADIHRFLHELLKLILRHLFFFDVITKQQGVV